MLKVALLCFFVLCGHHYFPALISGCRCTGDSPLSKDVWENLWDEVIEGCHGLPLMLEVLGATLRKCRDNCVSIIEIKDQLSRARSKRLKNGYLWAAYCLLEEPGRLAFYVSQLVLA